MFDATTLVFQWPRMLWLTALAPLLLVGYLWLSSRRGRLRQQYPSLQTIGAARGPAGRVVRALPLWLYLLAITAWLLAIARPQAVVTLPSHVETVVLAMDMSGSMRATDVEPNRMVAAKEAAKSFVADQPRQVRIGVVALAGSAALVQSPTRSREQVEQAIDRLEVQRGTALGSGLVISLTTLAPDADIDIDQFINGRAGRSPGAGRPTRREGDPQPAPVAPGSEGSSAIVLLSDGQSNTGPDPMKAAELAAQRGVRIFTVGVGTPSGSKITVDGWSMRVRLDEDSLKRIATMTDGEYFRAADAVELKRIYRHLSAKLSMGKQETTEVTALFVAAGALLAMLAGALSMLWFHRIL